MPKLAPSEIASACEALPKWKLQGSEIRRTFEFPDFTEAMRFVNWVAQVAEEHDHHPDIDIRWNRVTLALTTHDEGGRTAQDFKVAGLCDKLASEAPCV